MSANETAALGSAAMPGWVAIAAALIFFAACAEEKPESISTKSYGKVLRVFNCHNAGKHEYECDVLTEGGLFDDTGMSNWPGGGVEVGDSIFLEYRRFNSRTDIWRCNYKACRWMARQ